MRCSHKALLLYTENGDLEEKHSQDTELLTFPCFPYLKKADSNYVNPPTATPTMLIQTQITGRQFLENEQNEPSKKTILKTC